MRYAIQKSSNIAILKHSKVKENKPWVDETFLELIEARNKSNKREERLDLNKQAKKYRDKIKNEYYGKKAAAINIASEARDVEEEFRLARNYSSLNKTKRLLITPDKLKDHFEKHFSPRNLETQPEVENPDLFPHILPPENTIVNEDVPTEDELRQIIKKQKDSKCQGTDKIYAEHIK